MENGSGVANNIQIFWNLKTNAKKVDALVDKVKELGLWARITPSFWYVDSLLTASEARDQLTPLLQAGDCLFVVDASNGQAAWQGLPEEVGAHIKSHWSN